MPTPSNAYIVEAVRTAGGKRNGQLSGYHPIDLGAAVLDALCEKTNLNILTSQTLQREAANHDSGLIDDVIFGNLSQIGAQSGNLARNCVLASTRVRDSVPGVTLDRQCGSGQQAIHFAAQAVMSETQDIVVAGGVEVMSLCPIGSAPSDGMKCGRGMPISNEMLDRKPNVKIPLLNKKTPSSPSDVWAQSSRDSTSQINLAAYINSDDTSGSKNDPTNISYREVLQKEYTDKYGYSSGIFTQFAGADMLARKYDISREDLDKFSARSHSRADAATKAGRFTDEIVPIPIKKSGSSSSSSSSSDTSSSSSSLALIDEGIRSQTTLQSLSKLPPLDPKKVGKVTAGSASQICDGASALLIANENGLRKLGISKYQTLARIVQMAVTGGDPVIMLEGPIAATRKVLRNAGITITDCMLYEVNEAFASVPLAWQKALNADEKRLNVNGGAIGLGHPIGSTGSKLMCTLAHELKKRKIEGEAESQSNNHKKYYGLLAICEGGGTANATIIEAMGGNNNLNSTGQKVNSKL